MAEGHNFTDDVQRWDSSVCDVCKDSAPPLPFGTEPVYYLYPGPPPPQDGRRCCRRRLRRSRISVEQRDRELLWVLEHLQNNVQRMVPVLDLMITTMERLIMVLMSALSQNQQDISQIYEQTPPRPAYLSKPALRYRPDVGGEWD